MNFSINVIHLHVMSFGIKWGPKNIGAGITSVCSTIIHFHMTRQKNKIIRILQFSFFQNSSYYVHLNMLALSIPCQNCFGLLKQQQTLHFSLNG